MRTEKTTKLPKKRAKRKTPKKTTKSQKKTPTKKPSTARRERQSTPQEVPALRFSPFAWAKLLCLRDAGETEIGGFGISAAGDVLLVEDVTLIAQQCDWASVEFDDEAVADFFDGQVDEGRRPEQFGRIWIHTHPGNSPRPSGTDEATFARVFGQCDWAIMFILACGGASYARLQFGVGPGASVELPVKVDFTAAFAESDQLAWLAEY